jgi:hypothetical protein
MHTLHQLAVSEAEDRVTPHHGITEEYAPFTPVEIKAMRNSLKEQGLLMPIVTWNGQIVDGRHREKLCRELRIMPRYVEISGTCQTEEQMRGFVAAMNEHRRARTTPLTNEEKRALVAAELEEDPARSDRAIGKAVGVDHKTVAAARKEVGNFPTPVSERKSKTGKIGEGQHKSKPAPDDLRGVPQINPSALVTQCHLAVEEQIKKVASRLAPTDRAVLSEILHGLITELLGEPAATVDPPNAKVPDNPPVARQAGTLVADKPGVPKEKESLPTGDDGTYVGHDVELNALCEELELKDRKEMQAAEAPEEHIPIPAFLDRRREIATKVARPAPVNMVPRPSRQTGSTSARTTDRSARPPGALRSQAMR